MIKIEQAKLLKSKGFDVPTPHCFVHDTDEEYYFEYFSFFVGTFCGTLSDVYADEKEIRKFDLTKNPISNESEIYFNYNQDIRKLIARLYNGKEYMNDEKSFNMYINSYDWQKLTAEEEDNLKIELPNYNDGDFDFTVYQDVVSAPEQWQVIKWLLDNHKIDIIVKYPESNSNKIEGINSVYYDLEIYRLDGGDAYKLYKFNDVSDDKIHAYSVGIDYVLNNLI
jgi:hypothetical protein